MVRRIISFSLVFHVVASGVFADQARENSTGVPVEIAKHHHGGGNVESGRQGKAMGNSIYAGFITCAFQYDAACFVDVARKYLDVQKRQLLAQADEEVSRANPSTSLSNKPSQIASSIEKLFSELTNLFRDSLSNFFGKGDDEDSASETKEVAEDDDEEDDDDKKDNSSRDVGEGRKLKKKKKGPIKRLFAAIKLGILAVVVVVKISLVIKLFEAALKLKLVLIAAGAVFLQGLKLWMEFRNKKHEEGGIIYHNPHHADVGGFGDAEFAGPGEFHGREDSVAQNLAYSSYAHT